MTSCSPLLTFTWWGLIVRVLLTFAMTGTLLSTRIQAKWFLKGVRIGNVVSMSLQECIQRFQHPSRRICVMMLLSSSTNITAHLISSYEFVSSCYSGSLQTIVRSKCCTWASSQDKRRVQKLRSFSTIINLFMSRLSLISPWSLTRSSWLLQYFQHDPEPLLSQIN